ncbi:MAG TPA: ABC transporter permease [Pseudonocardiaceae bacterium]|jgi:putative ABC transport system permease protein|nr:ABC transporter permease [Pseudonocardiaceae bacterium]
MTNSVSATAIRPLPHRARLTPLDMLRLGTLGVRGRPGRTVLSVLGIAIGITAVVSVLGISSTSQAGLLAEIGRLGTNMLTVSPGRDLFGQQTELPVTAVPMVRRINGVQSATGVGQLPDATVRRTDKIDPEDTNGIGVVAVGTDLLGTVGGQVAHGTFLNSATQRYPAVVLGSVAASRLGISNVSLPVYLGNQWFTVVGILDPVELAPDIDRSALIGTGVATDLFGYDGHATTVYERSTDDTVTSVQQVLAATADPQNPENVLVSRPSDALTAQLATRSAFNSLFLGLGAVALLVGGIGVANTMVISVLERRSEIGMRRSLGATRGQVRLQFVTESAVLSTAGGALGVALGLGVSEGYARLRDWPAVLPWQAVGIGIGSAILTGVIAGIYPAARAARLAPTEALASA